MPTRKHTIFTGKTFTVPTYIVRIDGARSHGWQLRLGPWKLFSDHSQDGSGAARALREAKAELARRLARLPAKTGLRSGAAAGKAHGMPLGISGPHKRLRGDSGVAQYYLQVSYPVFGGKPVNRSVYVATDNTLSRPKWQAALDKALALREAGVRAFRQAATRSQRAAAHKLGAGGAR